MGRKAEPISRAELQRRQQQSLRDRETQRRQAQSVRDRTLHRLTQALAQHIRGSISAQRSGHALPLPLKSIMAPAPPSKVESNSERAFDRLFNNTKYSDVTMFLGESKFPFPAHQLVLGIRSAYFDTAFQSGLKEGITKDFTFERESPHALWRVFQYIYKGDYSAESCNLLDSEGDDLELLIHPRVYALADMFRIEELKQLSCKKFQVQLEQHWISDTLPDCIREVYATSIETGPHSVKTAVVDAVYLHQKELIQKLRFQELIRQVGDFAVDLMVKVADSHRTSH